MYCLDTGTINGTTFRVFIAGKLRGLLKEFRLKLRSLFVNKSICNNIKVVLGNLHEK